jgi:hypothetical protein
MSNFVNFGGLVLDVEWFPLVDARDPETIFVQDRNDGEWRFVDAATLDAPVCAALRAWAAGLAPEQEEEDVTEEMLDAGAAVDLADKAASPREWLRCAYKAMRAARKAGKR